MGSKRRSAEYYQSNEGRKKKRAHNEARNRSPGDEALPPVSPDPLPDASSPLPSESMTPEASSSVASSQPPEGPEFKESIVEYTRLIMALTERRKVSRDEALATLRRVVRQRSLDSP